MIQLKTLLETQLIKEALPLSMAKQYVNIRQNPSIRRRLDSIMSELAKQPDAKVSKRGDRVAIPFDVEFSVSDSTPSSELIKFYNALDGEREQANFIISQSPDSDKKKLFPGYANLFTLVMPTIKDQYGREVKMSKYITAVMSASYSKVLYTIEKLLKQDPDTGKLVMIQNDGTKISADEARARYRNILRTEIEKLLKQYAEIPEVKELRASKSKRYYIVFSKHPYDVAGMSTMRGWSSCMNLYGGMSSRYVQQDIAAGSMISYLVSDDDLNIENPSARLLIKPFVNIDDSKDVYYQPEDKVYGTAPIVFKQRVFELMDIIQPDKSGTFQLMDTLYCDSKNRVTKFGDSELPKKVSNLIQNRQQATTVDEAKYLLYKYCGYPDDASIKHVSFEESDKLYATGGQLYITVNNSLDYCPVAVDMCRRFSITRPKDYSSFPVVATELVIQQLNLGSFNGLNTVIKESLSLLGGNIGNFEGLQPHPLFKKIYIRPEVANTTTIRSFKGIPSSVNNLHIPFTKGQIFQLHMTLDDLITALKPAGLQQLNLPLHTPGLLKYASKSDRSISDANNGDKLTDSILKKIDSIPRWEMFGEERLADSRYYRFLGWLSTQLPTVMFWGEYMMSNYRDLKQLPTWAYPENW